MKIEQNRVVTINYTLKNTDGIVLDSSEGRDPLVYLHGVGGLIPGLERELEGKGAGESLNAVIPPEEAYGNHSAELVHVVPKSGFKGADNELQEGMRVQLDTPQGPAVASVTRIEGEDVTLDLNHPLADETLHFAVDVVEVREATEDEISHGHAHGPGGVEH